MHILITGATGFIGSDLCKFWLEQGHQVTAFVRDRIKATEHLGTRIEFVTSLGRFDAGTRIDAIVNLAGAPIADHLWTRSYRTKLARSRLKTTRDLVKLVTWLRKKPKVMLSASAAGYYGRRGAEPLSEKEPPQDIFMSSLCRRWEEAAAPAADHGVRLVIPRIAVVLDKNGGALPKLAGPAKFGFASVIGSGRQYFPWIHKHDLIELFDYLLADKAISGPVNAVAPGATTQREFNLALTKALHRPLFLRMPALAFKLMLGEMSDLFIAGQHMSAEKALTAGFDFRFPDIESAFADLFHVQHTAHISHPA